MKIQEILIGHVFDVVARLAPYISGIGENNKFFFVNIPVDGKTVGVKITPDNDGIDLTWVAEANIFDDTADPELKALKMVSDIVRGKK